MEKYDFNDELKEGIEEAKQAYRLAKSGYSKMLNARREAVKELKGRLELYKSKVDELDYKIRGIHSQIRDLKRNYCSENGHKYVHIGYGDYTITGESDSSFRGVQTYAYGELIYQCSVCGEQKKETSNFTWNSAIAYTERERRNIVEEWMPEECKKQIEDLKIVNQLEECTQELKEYQLKYYEVKKMLEQICTLFGHVIGPTHRDEYTCGCCGNTRRLEKHAAEHLNSLYYDVIPKYKIDGEESELLQEYNWFFRNTGINYNYPTSLPLDEEYMNNLPKMKRRKK